MIIKKSILLYFSSVLVSSTLLSTVYATGPIPPSAHKVPHTDIFHADPRVDNYRWMHDNKDPAVRKHLELENQYAKAYNAKNQTLQTNLEKEYKALRKDKTEVIQWMTKKYIYHKKSTSAENYFRLYRENRETGSTKLYFDANDMAKDKKYFGVVAKTTNKSEDKMVISMDFSGRGHGQPHLLDMNTLKLEKLPIKLVWGKSIIWVDKTKLLFFGAKNEIDPTNLYEYDLNTKTSKLIHTFEDTTSFRRVTKTQDKTTYLIQLTGTVAYKNFSYDPTNKKVTLLEFSNPKYKESFYKNAYGLYKLSNEHNKNYQVYKLNKNKWEMIYAPKTGDISRIQVGSEYIIINKNDIGLASLIQLELKTNILKAVPNPENLSTVQRSFIDEKDQKLHFSIAGFSFPNKSFVCQLSNCNPNLTRVDSYPALKNKKYTAKRIMVTARDNQQIPVSIIYREDLYTGINQPMKLYGYGSYGSTISPRFLTSEIPLMDRGVIYAIAHIRGGGIKGEKWHDAGRMKNKMNTFHDFIDVAEYFINNKVTSPNKLAIQGESAGGLLVGSVINMRPELFKVAMLGVPFVDVLNTMTLYYDPLAKYEKNEWGDGLIEQQYSFIKSYDPYTNLKTQNYPSILVSTGFEDTAVYYFQPMKWVAKMRELNDSHKSNPMIFFTTFEGGHGGGSGEEAYEKTQARNQSFILGELFSVN